MSSIEVGEEHRRHTAAGQGSHQVADQEVEVGVHIGLGLVAGRIVAVHRTGLVVAAGGRVGPPDRLHAP